MLRALFCCAIFTDSTWRCKKFYVDIQGIPYADAWNQHGEVRNFYTIFKEFYRSMHGIDMER
jgi:hypothetical protein